MRYQLAPIACRPWLLSGLSRKLIESHYENNYGGAVRRLNSIAEQLASLDYATAPANVVNGLKREELVALNSSLLHELYFASLGGDGKTNETVAQLLARDFGISGSLAQRVCRHGERTGRRIGLGAARLRAA